MSRAKQSLTVVISGTSGLVGGALASLLRAKGHRVIPLVRRAPRTGSDEVRWDPEHGEIDATSLDGAAAVVHLGGLNVAGQRWTQAYKAAIRDSRVRSTHLLSQAASRLANPPGVLICASATGYYGDRGDEWLSEGSPPGEGFLPDLCQAWEAAAEPARNAGLRVVNLRIGVVLASQGGALRKMLPLFKTGFGGVLGSGRQYLSWIALSDLIRAFEFVVTTEHVAGPVNAVAPNPVTNREFTRALGRVLRRPTICRVPSFAVRLMFGEMGRTLLLEGNRVRPARLEQARFEFQCPQLEDALRFELGLARPPQH